MTLRVLLVEDENLVRQGIRKLLELDPRIEIAAEAGDGEEALRLIGEVKPDVVLLDVRMPKLDGMGVLRALREDPEAPPCLVLTTFDDREVTLAAIREGARGFLRKDVSLEHLLEAIETLAAGGTYLQPTVVLCDSPEHPLANREFLFPFAAVVAVSPDEMQRMPRPMGKTLVVTALSGDRALVNRLLGSSLVDRLNVGAIQTNKISWDQPHEGNLFEHLYARRSFQMAAPAFR